VVGRPTTLINVLVACEFSGRVRDAFAARGFEAWSCDYLPSETEGPHYQGNILDILDKAHRWDLVIAHPPCTRLAVSGAWTWKGKEEEQRQSIDFFMRLYNCNCDNVAVENPIGIMSSVFRKPDQIIQPYQFGEDASKSTCLWLKGLPKLVPTDNVPPRMVNGRPRWANQTPSGQNKLGPSKTRANDRARTYRGIAEAMAQQWGDYLLDNLD